MLKDIGMAFNNGRNNDGHSDDHLGWNGNFTRRRSPFGTSLFGDIHDMVGQQIMWYDDDTIMIR